MGVRALVLAFLVAACAARGATETLGAMRRSLGTGEGIQRVQTRVQGSGPSGPYELDLDLPRDGVWSFTWRFPGRPERRIEIEGQHGRRVDAAEQEPLTLAEVLMVRTHAFPWLVVDLGRFFPAVQSAGTRFESGRRLDLLRLVDPLGNAASAAVDRATARLVRLEVLDTSQDPPATVRLDFEAWQEVEGFTLPARVVAYDPSGVWTMELRDVRVERVR